MPRLNLTVRTLENLKPPGRPGQRIEYFDDTVPGFGVRVTYEGHKTFTFLYRLKAKKCRISLGTPSPRTQGSTRGGQARVG